MRVELLVDGEIVFQENVDTEKLAYKLFHLKALARSKYRKNYWELVIIKRAHEGGNPRINVDMNKVASMQRSGMNLVEIAASLKIHLSTLTQRRKEAGLVFPYKNWNIKEAFKLKTEEHWTLARLSEKYGVSSSIISKRLIEIKNGKTF